jgi:hypothetical protein
VSQKGHLLFFRSSFLFVRPKRNEPWKKGSGNDSFNIFWQKALSIMRPKKAEGRSTSKSKDRIKKQLDELWNYAESVAREELENNKPEDLEKIDQESVPRAIKSIDRALKVDPPAKPNSCSG